MMKLIGKWFGIYLIATVGLGLLNTLSDTQRGFYVRSWGSENTFDFYAKAEYDKQGAGFYINNSLRKDKSESRLWSKYEAVFEGGYLKDDGIMGYTFHYSFDGMNYNEEFHSFNWLTVPLMPALIYLTYQRD